MTQAYALSGQIPFWFWRSRDMIGSPPSVRREREKGRKEDGAREEKRERGRRHTHTQSLRLT